MTKISLIFPCYNEEEGIPQLKREVDPVVKALQENYDVEVIFVDDGSQDRTNELLHQYFADYLDADYLDNNNNNNNNNDNENNDKDQENDEENEENEDKNKLSCQIVKHEVNQNLGAALKTGFAFASGDLIATFDSDCTYSPTLIFPMLEKIKDADLVTSFAGNITDVPAYRMFLSKSASNLYRILVSPKVHVYTCLTRLYKKEVLENITIKRNDFLAVLEIMVKAVLKGYKVQEFPGELKNRQFGVTKMKTAKTIGSHLNFMGKIIAHRLLKIKL